MAGTVLFEARAAYDTWLKLLLGFPVVILLVETYFLAREKIGDLHIMAGTLLLLAIIYWLILPRGYRIYNDAVTIMLGWPCSLPVKFSSIVSADRHTRGAGFGINFAGSSRNVIAIKRKKWLTVHISPADPDLFLTNLKKALLEWRKYYDKTD